MTDEVDEVTENFSEEEKSEESEIIDPIKILEEKIQELEKEKQYSTAEIVNLRQRYARERNTLVKFSSMNLASKILPVLDNLEKAISIEDNESDKFIEGVNMTLKSLRSTLENEGVQKIDARDKLFDPSFMEAIAVIPTPEGKEPGSVVEIVEEGYMFHDRVLRPVKVIVSDN
ncbi:MAG: nucleotide exchange factor GrpE [Candidatus Thalassarchaeaceae archaeon]|jgi:molecular chaperone GrpE|nr:nucleotide exchange factor GrpE [Candidatus Thalassarchaeaceae archaeon]|tara:strand:+ start:540 stop:1058 length:519 start_codon:yes stop_codon:yes gene_type:complete